jgi:hypothetical protein
MKEVPNKDNIGQQVVEAAQAASAGLVGKATMGGALSAFGLGALSASEVGMLIGAAVALGGLLLQAVLGLRKDRREQREHEARMASEFGRGNAPGRP